MLFCASIVVVDQLILAIYGHWGIIFLHLHSYDSSHGMSPLLFMTFRSSSRETWFLLMLLFISVVAAVVLIFVSHFEKVCFKLLTAYVSRETIWWWVSSVNLNVMFMTMIILSTSPSHTCWWWWRSKSSFRQIGRHDSHDVRRMNEDEFPWVDHLIFLFLKLDMNHLRRRNKMNYCISFFLTV